MLTTMYNNCGTKYNRALSSSDIFHLIIQTIIIAQKTSIEGVINYYINMLPQMHLKTYSTSNSK